MFSVRFWKGFLVASTHEAGGPQKLVISEVPLGNSPPQIQLSSAFLQPSNIAKLRFPTEKISSNKLLKLDSKVGFLKEKFYFINFLC